MQCPKCQEENPIHVRFCRRCGEPMGGVYQLLRGKWGIGALLLIGMVAAAYFIVGSERAATAVSPEVKITPVAPVKVHVGVAYGTEKKDWFTWAAAEFAKTSEGQNVEIDLKGMGSLESAQAIVNGDTSIQVWSPAGAMYRNVFVRDWALKYPQTTPFTEEQPLALTPMVFVMWQERYDAFAQKYQGLSFKNLSTAMNEPGGWNTIAAKPEWGFFKFSHTHPNESNSGLVSLVLMAYDYHDRRSVLGAAEITDPAFQQWIGGIEKNLVGASSGLIGSTGTLMNAMVQRGWSTYDCVLVYEANAIDRLRQANGRWGALRVVYPKYNLWNDHPYYVLNAPWCTPEQKAAAKAFEKFLLSDRAQREAMTHGFRPANVNVPTNEPDSPFVRYADVGIAVNPPGTFREPPSADVIESLLLGWQRSQVK